MSNAAKFETPGVGDDGKVYAFNEGGDAHNLTDLAAVYQPLDSDLTAIAALTTTSFGRALLALADAAALRTAAGLVIGTDVQAFDTDLAAIAALTSAADKVAYSTGAGTWALADLTSAGRALLDDANASAQRTTLGLVIGTDVQAQDADLAALAAISGAQGDVIYHNGTSWVALTAGTTGQFLKTQGAAANPVWATIGGGGDLLAANNLSDVASASTARTNLGLAIGTNVQAYAAALDAVTGTNTGDEVAASLTVAGVVELATVAETDTGTDATRAVTPAGLAGSALASKVNGVEVGADVTDAANVLAALAAAAPTVAVATTGDKFLFQDATDTNIIKTIDYADLPGAAGGLSNIVEDVTPQLGGDLDLNTHVITGLVIGTNVQAYSAALDAVTGTNTGDEPAASLTVAGKVELATVAETDTGTDATRATTPAGIAGSALQLKVNGIAAGATANSSDATLLARANHTGTQAAGTITGLAAIATSGSATDLAAGSVPAARFADGTINISKLNATGTPSGSTYLCGDGSWSTPAGGGGGSVAGGADHLSLITIGVS